MKNILQILLLGALFMLNSNTCFSMSYNYNNLNNHSQEKSNQVQKQQSQKIFLKIKKRVKKQQGKHGFGGIISVVLGLTALFVGLKLANVIAWSWIWVIAPIWITIALMILIFIYVVILFLTMPEKQILEAIPEEKVEENTTEQ